jgi:hypothetical protein
MPITYEEAVPWGRTFAEYQRMFALSEADLALNILGCGDGPASFNAEMTKHGHRVTSCDPLYQFTKAQIEDRIEATYQAVLAQTRQNQDKFIWDAIKSVDELGRVRMGAMKAFVADYETGKQEGRYITAELPTLPFTDKAFDLAVCSHFLFLYTDNFSLEFHQQSIEELCRVASEVRIFPILTYNAIRSPYVDSLMELLAAAGHQVTIEQVPYEFQRGGNQMMRVIAAK